MVLKRKPLLPIGLTAALVVLVLIIALAMNSSANSNNMQREFVNSTGSSGGNYGYAAPTLATIDQEQAGGTLTMVWSQTSPANR